MSVLNSLPVPIVVLLGLALAYPLIARGLLEWAHPKRLRVIELGRELLHDSKLTSAQKDSVWAILEFNGRSTPMLCLAALAPFGLLLVLFFRETERDREVDGLIEDPRFTELMDLEAVTSAAASPIAALYLFIQLVFATVTGLAFYLGFEGLRRVVLKTIRLTRDHRESGAARA